MKFTWLANSPWTPSGYGQQTRIFVPRFAEQLGHDVGIICYHGLEGGILSIMPGVTCIPKRMHPYGNDIHVTHSAAFGAQFAMSLMDTWVMNPEEFPQHFKWIPWYPVDTEPMPEIIRSKLSLSYMRVSFSQHGTRMTHNAGLDCDYIPHGLETSVLKPMDKRAAREVLNFPQDKWIVGTVAMNKGQPSRKNFVEMITAFAKFKRSHPDAFYFLQTDRGENMPDVVNIPELARSLGLIEGEDYGFCNQYQNLIGFPPDYFVNLYNAIDVHMLVSAGEGFGLPTLEAQACGTPVIVGDWTAHTELCHAGRMVAKSDAYPHWTGLAAYHYIPRVDAIVDLLEQEYQHPTDTSDAAEWVKANYDADMLVQTAWKPFFEKVEAAL